MSHYILDACALINLHCGWGGLAELQTFGTSWSIGDTALSEALFVRDFDLNGDIYRMALDSQTIVANAKLKVLTLGNAPEYASLVEFALELDDGEAQALSLALHRQRILVTDDRPAVRVASGPASVQTVGTPEILMAWIDSNPQQRHRLPTVVRRMSVLGPFQLKKSSVHYGWWQALLSNGNTNSAL